MGGFGGLLTEGLSFDHLSLVSAAHAGLSVPVTCRASVCLRGMLQEMYRAACHPYFPTFQELTEVL